LEWAVCTVVKKIVWQGGRGWAQFRWLEQAEFDLRNLKVNLWRQTEKDREEGACIIKDFMVVIGSETKRRCKE
jgi:hypothetical protein